MTHCDALVLGVGGCFFFAREVESFGMGRDESCFAPGDGCCRRRGREGMID